MTTAHRRENAKLYETSKSSLLSVRPQTSWTIQTKSPKVVRCAIQYQYTKLIILQMAEPNRSNSKFSHFQV